jgi:regulator of RNase E activity RraA
MPGESEWFETIRRTLYTPVVGDILDGCGYYHQFLPQAIQPIREDFVVVGRAMPVLCAAVSGPQQQPFGRLTEALDQIQPGEVYLATGAFDCASWGEILTAAARTRGGAGAVIDGFHRDTRQVLAQNWPVFSRGRYAQDAGVRSGVVDFRIPLEIGGVRVNPGDLVFGDLDGVLVVPRAIEQEAIGHALEKARGEKIVRREIEQGVPSTEVFRKYGIL